MMMCGGNKKVSLSVRNAGNLHTPTHTPISVVEKIFKVSFREAMNESSCLIFYVVKKFLLAIKV